MKLSTLYAGAALCALYCGALPLAGAQTYTYTDLSPNTYSWATAINNAGQIVGATGSSEAGLRATFWDGTTTKDLGTLGGPYSIATAINNSGKIAGTSMINANTSPQAVVWNGAAASSISVLGQVSTEALAINSSGQIVGNIENAIQAVRWDGTVATILDNKEGHSSRARGINDAGQVVGTTYVSYDSVRHATVWDGTTTTYLAVPGGRGGSASAINNVGQIAGSIDFDGYNERAVVWNSTTATATVLDSLGYDRNYVSAMNNHGQIVGYAGTINPDGGNTLHAVLWNGTTIVDLNTLLDPEIVRAGWVLDYAYGINDSGSIVGSARNSSTGETHAYLLSVSAVPEPETYGMLLAGLGLIGGVLRRRRI